MFSPKEPVLDYKIFFNQGIKKKINVFIRKKNVIEFNLRATLFVAN